jgi:uncharacterized membrane protein YphA (DoxX/SURF4 family)
MATQSNKTLHWGLWVLQLLLAAAFLMAGGMKVATPAAELAAQGMHEPIAILRIAGTSEVLGALGLVLPAALRIKPKLTGVAAAALTLVMVLAVLTHVFAGDIGGAVPALVLGALSAFVAWGRLIKAPIAPKGA